ncbi:MAG: hypothetical protein ACTSPV_14305 [Candidatus Hodarchaeales archaeon]
MVLNPKSQPTYDIIKRKDLEGAFRDSLGLSMTEVLERINAMIDLYSATAPSSLWTWGATSRWDYDMWW